MVRGRPARAARGRRRTACPAARRARRRCGRAGGGAGGDGRRGARRRAAAGHRRARPSAASPRSRRLGRRDRGRAGDRHGEGGGRGRRAWCARSTAPCCGRSRRRRCSAPTCCAARSTRDACSRPPPTTPRWWRRRAGACAWSRRRPRTSRSRALDLDAGELLRARALSFAVLTDYHVHLRPDDARAPAAERYFTHANAERYQEVGGGARDRGARASPSTSTASARRSTSGSTRSGAPARRRPRRVLRVRARSGPRARHRGRLRAGPRGPDGEPARGARLGLRHRLGALPPRRGARHARRVGHVDDTADPEKVWSATSRRSARRRAAGMFDVLAHPDLVKVWGPSAAPDGDLRRFYDLAMDGIAESDVAIEVSTAGLRKPVGEIYPARGVPRDVPRGGPAGRAVLGRPRARTPRPTATTRRSSSSTAGRRAEIAVFERRERRLEPLG